MDIIDRLQALCEEGKERGVPVDRLKAGIGTIYSAVSTDRALTEASASGKIYEFLRMIYIRRNNYELLDPTNIADNVYSKGGENAVPRVRQQKWVPGSGRGALRENLKSALEQLAGVMPGNPERAPAGSMAIADIVLTNPHQGTTAMLTGNFEEYVSQLLTNTQATQGSTLQQTGSVSVRIMVMGNATSTKYSLTLSNGVVTVSPPDTKARELLVHCVALTAQLGQDVEISGKELVRDEIRGLENSIEAL